MHKHCKAKCYMYPKVACHSYKESTKNSASFEILLCIILCKLKKVLHQPFRLNKGRSCSLSAHYFPTKKCVKPIPELEQLVNGKRTISALPSEREERQMAQKKKRKKLYYVYILQGWRTKITAWTWVSAFRISNLDMWKMWILRCIFYARDWSRRKWYSNSVNVHAAISTEFSRRVLTRWFRRALVTARNCWRCKVHFTLIFQAAQ